MARNVIVELRYTPELAAAAAAVVEAGVGEVDARTAATEVAAAVATVAAVVQIPSLRIDPVFPPVAVPSSDAPSVRAATMAGPDAGDGAEETEVPLWEEQPEFTSIVVRGQIDDDAWDELAAQGTAARRSGRRGSSAVADAVAAAPEVVQVFADPQIQVCLICPGDPPKGTDADVARLLCVSRLHQRQMNGSGVMVAIVDTGINRAHLVAHGQSPIVDVARSWAPPGVPGTGGSWPVDHGTMCAYDALIAAPRCTLLDIAVLRSRRPGATVMDGLLSDAVLAYRHLLNIMIAPWRPGERRSLVVNNSWGMFHPSWDFPVGHAGNYSDNPNHPFTRIVATLERAGADILFAAGNCGRDCPDGRCQGVTAKTIYGANGSPAVLTVGGVDVTGLRVGYSSTGPGRLVARKPDLCGFTHFKGSGVYAADGGTSAATPVVTGVVAALRTARPFVPGNPLTFPAQMRDVLRATALDRGAPGFDFDYGYGIINGCRLSVMVTTEDTPTFEGLLREMEATAAPTSSEPRADRFAVSAEIYAAPMEASPAGAAGISAGSPTEAARGMRASGPAEPYVASMETALSATPAGPAAAETISSA